MRKLSSLVGLTICLAPGLASGQRDANTGLRAFAIEAAGGVVGSAVGIGVVLVVLPECRDNEDTVRCALLPAAAALAAATAMSATGAVLAGRAFDTHPSVPGAILGAIGGAFAGIGVDHLLREELNVHHNRVATVMTLAIMQGLLTAATSRLFVEARRR